MMRRPKSTTTINNNECVKLEKPRKSQDLPCGSCLIQYHSQQALSSHFVLQRSTHHTLPQPPPKTQAEVPLRGWGCERERAINGNLPAVRNICRATGGEERDHSPGCWQFDDVTSRWERVGKSHGGHVPGHYGAASSQVVDQANHSSLVP